jgi:hypothetical protein
LDNFYRTHTETEDLNPYAERVEFWPLLNGFTPDMFDNDKLKDGAIRASSVKLHPKWDIQGKECTSYDIAVLNLNTKAGYEYGCCVPELVTPLMANTDIIDTYEAYISGYPVGKGDISFVLTECKGKFMEPYNSINRAFYNVNPGTQHGQSGGGIRLVKGEKHYTIGTHTRLEFDKRNKPIGAGGTVFSQPIYDSVKTWVTNFEESNVESSLK